MDIKNEVDTFVLENLPVFTADTNKPKINWLKGLAPKFNHIVHYGCADGQQTLSLAWILQTEEVVGVDNDPSAVEAANAMKTNFYAQLKKLNDMIRAFAKQVSGNRQTAFLTAFKTYFAGLSGETYEAVLKKYKIRKFPDFVVGDMANQTEPKSAENELVKAGYFDLVFCDHVLEHIAYKTKARDDELARAAVEEMVRAAREDGVIVAITPNVFDFKDIFESFPLIKIPVSQDLDIFEDYNVYVYRKGA